MRSVVLLCWVLALAGCDRNEVTGPSSPLNTDFTLSPGQSMTVDDIGVRFLRVLSDSRCPLNALCISSGDAVLTIAVSTTTDGRDYQLRANTMKSVTHSGRTIHLVQLAPYPIAPVVTPLTDYLATFRVTR